MRQTKGDQGLTRSRIHPARRVYEPIAEPGGTNGDRASRSVTGNSGPVGGAGSRDRNRLGRRDLVLFGGRRVDARLRLLRPRRLSQLPLRRSRVRAARGRAKRVVPAHGQVQGRARSDAFPIGAGCTQTFARSGELVVFANDALDGYADNRGAVTLTVAPGGVAPAPASRSAASSAGGVASAMFSRTKGIPVIAALVIGVSAILVFMQQGQDLVRGDRRG